MRTVEVVYRYKATVAIDTMIAERVSMMNSLIDDLYVMAMDDAMIDVNNCLNVRKGLDLEVYDINDDGFGTVVVEYIVGDELPTGDDFSLVSGTSHEYLIINKKGYDYYIGLEDEYEPDDEHGTVEALVELELENIEIEVLW